MLGIALPIERHLQSFVPRALALGIALALSPRAPAAVLNVSSLADGPPVADGACTLREALASINAATPIGGCVVVGAFGVDDQIDFAAALAGTIVLAPGLGAFELNRPATINGPGTASLALDGGGQSNVFVLRADAQVRGLALRNGFAPAGGAIEINGAQQVRLADLAFNNNRAGEGGAVAIAAAMTRLEIIGSRFEDNLALVGNGGALAARAPGELRIEGSRFTGNQAFDRGGAIVLREARPGRRHQILTTRFEANEAGVDFAPTRDSTISGAVFGDLPLDGGAIHATLEGRDDGALTIGDSQFIANRAPRYGGALHLASVEAFEDLARFDIERSTLERNEAFLFGLGDGGAVYLRGGSLSFREATVSGNIAGDEGGAVYHRSGGTLIEDSTFDDNRAASWGGAFASFCGVTCVEDRTDAFVRIRRSTISRNQANTGGFDPVASGGGFSLLRDPVDIDNSTFSGNHLRSTWDPPATVDAAIYRQAGNQGQPLFDGLSGTEPPPPPPPPPPLPPPLGGGGAMLVYNPTVGELALRVRNSTFAGNVSATNRAGTGGVWVVGSADFNSAATVYAQSLGGREVNADLTLTRIEKTDETPRLSFERNLIEVPGRISLIFGTNVLGASAQLLPLAANGGPTKTHAIDVGSAAYGAGFNPDGFATDQRGPGFPRTIDSRTDIGAFQAPTGVSLVQRVDGPRGWMLAFLASLLAAGAFWRARWRR